MIEMTLVGIPVIFILITTFEVARAMWIYHTLAHAVKEGSRYASVHGSNCAAPPNACTVDIAQIAARIRSAGVGLIPEELQLSFTAANGVETRCLLRSCLTNTTTWPPSPANGVGSHIIISGSYPFRSPVALLWQRDAAAVIHFPASSQERIRF
jgi:Flp pilus assembly protein TadG